MPVSPMYEDEYGYFDGLAEQELAKTMKPLKGICATCASELEHDPHESWCPEA